MTQVFRKMLLDGCLSAALIAASLPSNGFAQNGAPAGDAAPKTGGVVTTTSSSSRVLEYGMVIVMFGAALFAVCRSSRRNV